jgi:hypothetical protein
MKVSTVERFSGMREKIFLPLVGLIEKNKVTADCYMKRA